MSKNTSQADMKGKGKAPVVQPKPKQSRKPYVRISDRHEGVSIETISLQDSLLIEAMYSCSGKSEILQEVLRTDLIFRDREFTDLPLHIKLLLDNLQVALTLRQKSLFQKTLKALELYLVNTVHLLKHLVVNSLAGRMEIQAPQRQNYSL